LALFGIESATTTHGGHHVGSQRFDITHLARLRTFNPQAIRVNIVPIALLKPRAGAPELRRDGGVVIERIRIILQEMLK
jgi:hypothetical protein